jgi:methyl coenzyme M reductase gamma subunit
MTEKIGMAEVEAEVDATATGGVEGKTVETHCVRLGFERTG